MKSRTKATFACLVATLAITAASGGTPAAAGSERMQLHCESGTLEGHTLERTNGSSWWNVETGTIYTTKSLTISDDDQGIVHHHDYGKKSQDADTCTAEHFDWTWDLEVVAAGP